MDKKRVTTEENQAYQNPTPGEIPIIAFDPVKSTSRHGCNVPDLKTLQYVKNCGCNVVMYGGSDVGVIKVNDEIVDVFDWYTYMQTALNLCQQLDLRLICMSGILCYPQSYATPSYASGWPGSLVEKIKDYPALAAYQVKDEPNYDQWHAPFMEYRSNVTVGYGENLQERKVVTIAVEYDMIKRTALIRSLDGTRMAFNNLAIGNEEQWVGPCISAAYPPTSGSLGYIAEYLAEYQAAFKPPVFSYDYYPVRCLIDVNKVPDDSTSFVNSAMFYRCLAEFSKISKKHNRPFWAYCMCSKHRTSPDELEAFPTPTEGVLRFEAFNALAHGAQGIVYYTFRVPLYVYEITDETKSEKGTACKATAGGGAEAPGDTEAPLKCRVPRGDSIYYNAPLDENGKPTEIYGMVRRVNSAIRSYEHVFLGCEVLDCVHVGATYDGLPMLKGAIGCFTSIVMANASGKPESVKYPGFLVSHIRNGENEYIVIVNHDPFNSQEVLLTYYSNVILYDPVEIPLEPANERMGVGVQPVPTPVTLRKTIAPGDWLVYSWAYSS